MELFGSTSAHEYAWDYVPDSGGTRTFIGNSHGNETEDSLSITVNGSDPGLTDGASASGTQIIVTRTTTLTHPDTANDVATVTTVYTLNASGLTVAVTTDWLEPGTVGAGYPAMLPCGEVLDRGAMSSIGSAAQTLTANDDSRWFQSRASAAWLWDGDGSYGMLVYSDDIDAAVNGWAKSYPHFGHIHDVSGGAFNKVYFARQGSSSDPEAVSNGEQWTSAFTYRAAKFANPESTLGAL